MNTVISVENLSKTYRLGTIGTGAFSRGLGTLVGKDARHLAANPMLRTP